MDAATTPVTTHLGARIGFSHGRCFGETATVVAAFARTFSATCDRCGQKFAAGHGDGYQPAVTVAR